MEEKSKKKKNPSGTRKKAAPNSEKKIILEIGRQPNIFRNILFYLVLGALIFMVFGFSSGFNPNAKQTPISEVIKLINEGKVQDITVAKDTVSVLLQDGTSLVSQKEAGVSFDEILANNNVDRSKIAGEIKVESKVSIEDILSPILWLGFPLVIFFLLIRQMKGASGDILSFGKARAKLFDKGTSKVTFGDVAGNAEAKRDMLEIVDFLKSPQKYRKLGARIPKGVLLVGPSGVGKTLLAKAIAGEAGVPFFSIAGSEFMEMLVGVGSARARDLFLKARETQPSLIFIDEIDAIGRQRGMGIGGGHDEREQTLNQILVEMDGFDERTSVIVIAATNRPDMLDPALIRPGRFDRRITIPLPDLRDRVEIIKIHMRGKPFTQDFDVEKVARKTVGFSGADIENMLNEAAILTARSNREEISEGDVDEASLKVTMGSERKTLQTEEEKRITASHEAGHAVVASFVPEMDPVQRVSIIARGASLGHTLLPPERDRYNETKTHLLSTITTMLGGRAAEEVIFNELTVGASDDIDRATKLARKMVVEFGMSSLGPISYSGQDEYNWLAWEMTHAPAYSNEMAAKIDAEIKKIIDSCYDGAKSIIVANKYKLDRVTSALLEKETIYGDDFRALIR